MKPEGILFSVGELSADLYAARLAAHLRELLPAIPLRALGGRELAAAGAEIIYPLADRPVMGLSEVLGQAGFLRRARAALRDELMRRPPRLLVLIDYGGFNLAAARLARKLSPLTKVLYYIPPKLWAWGAWRARRLARDTDAVLCILPFEPAWLRARGVTAEFVGHPLPELLAAELAAPLPAAPAPPALLLLPGSRPGEWERLLPDFLAAAAAVQRGIDCAVWLAPPPGMPRAWLTDILRRAPVPVVVREDRYAAMRQARVALAASGTVTLELALCDTPTVVAYKFAALTWNIFRTLATVKYASLPNLILDAPLLPELLQGACAPGPLAAAVTRLWPDAAQRTLRAQLAVVRGKLGSGPGLRAAAEKMTQYYGKA